MDDTVVFELLVDATDMARSFPIFEAVWHHDAFRGAVGTLLMAPAMQLALTTALTQRFLRGLAGSSLGLIGGAVLAVIPPAGVLVGYLFGPPIGASSAQGRCS